MSNVHAPEIQHVWRQPQTVCLCAMHFRVSQLILAFVESLEWLSSCVSRANWMSSSPPPRQRHHCHHRRNYPTDAWWHSIAQHNESHFGATVQFLETMILRRLNFYLILFSVSRRARRKTSKKTKKSPNPSVAVSRDKRAANRRSCTVHRHILTFKMLERRGNRNIFSFSFSSSSSLFRNPNAFVWARALCSCILSLRIAIYSVRFVTKKMCIAFNIIDEFTARVVARRAHHRHLLCPFSFVFKELRSPSHSPLLTSFRFVPFVHFLPLNEKPQVKKSHAERVKERWLDFSLIFMRNLLLVSFLRVLSLSFLLLFGLVLDSIESLAGWLADCLARAAA